MPSFIKVNGVWRSVVNPVVKVGTTWRTVSRSYVKVGGTWRRWFLGKVTDTFSRSTTAGNLGTSDTGTPWSVLRGSWFANGSQAQSNDAGTTYALAAVDFGSADVKVSTSVSGGTGPAFWVTDSGSWWAVQSYYETSTTCIQYGYYCSSYNCPGYSTSCCSPCACPDPNNCARSCTIVVSAPDLRICQSAYFDKCADIAATTQPVKVSGSCTGEEVWGNPAYVAYDGNDPNYPWKAYLPQLTTQTTTLYDGPCYPSPSTSCCTSACYCSSGFCCAASSCIDYRKDYFMRLIRSVAGTVTNILQVSITQAAAAIRVITGGNNITATAYSDTAMNTAIGNTLSSSQPDAVKGTSAGIVKGPSNFSQGSTVDNFSAESP